MQRVRIEPVRDHAVLALHGMIRAQRIDVRRSDDEQVTALPPFDVRRQRHASKAGKRNASAGQTMRSK